MRYAIYEDERLKAWLFQHSNNYFYLYLSGKIRKSLHTKEYFIALRRSFSVIDGYIKSGSMVRKYPLFNEVVVEYVKTIHNHDNIVKIKRFIGCFGKKLISEIKSDDIKELIFNRLELIQGQSVNREMALLKNVFRYALNKQYINEIPRFERVKEVKNKRLAFTDEEISEILSVGAARIDELNHGKNKFERELLLCYIKFLLYTGVRVGEALSIQIKSIKGQYAYVSKSKTLNREIYLNELALEVVREIKSIYARYGVSVRQESYLFMKYRGGAIRSFKRSFNALMMATSLKNEMGKNKLTMYSFRHTYITKSIKAGVPLTSISIQCGNSVEIIQKTYNHLSVHQVSDDLK